jgi:hypothetical protein
MLAPVSASVIGSEWDVVLSGLLLPWAASLKAGDDNVEDDNDVARCFPALLLAAAFFSSAIQFSDGPFRTKETGFTWEWVGGSNSSFFISFASAGGFATKDGRGESKERNLAGREGAGGWAGKQGESATLR